MEMCGDVEMVNKFNDLSNPSPNEDEQQLQTPTISHFGKRTLCRQYHWVWGKLQKDLHVLFIYTKIFSL
jgi:hypothetical protein